MPDLKFILDTRFEDDSRIDQLLKLAGGGARPRPTDDDDGRER